MGQLSRADQSANAAKCKWGNFMKRRISLTAKAAVMAALACISGGGALLAEPVTDRVLSHYQIASRNGCSVLKLNFNIRIRYVSHFPVSSGNQLNIMVRPIDPQIAAAESFTARESLRPPEGNTAALQSIVYEVGTAQGSVLSLQFSRPVAFNVALGSDFQSLIIALAGDKGKLCPASEESFNWETVLHEHGNETIAARRKSDTSNETVIIRREKAKRPSVIGPSMTAESVMETKDTPNTGIRAARTAMKQGDMPRAIELLKDAEGPEAKELLGVAYQKNKQTAEARAVYEDYLRRYGNGEGAEGVRQRLAAIETANAAPAEQLRGGTQSSGETVRDRSYWTVSGSVSEFYIRDDSFRVTHDPTQPLNLNAEADDHLVHRNVLMSGVDLFAAWGNPAYKSKFRFSGTEEHGFDDGNEIVSVSTLYYDTTIKEWGTTARVGRQTRSNDGVLGRFDGAYASWQTTSWMRLSAVGGSPVASRKDEPFKNDRYFYGASVNFGQLIGGFDTSFFVIEQRDRDIVDRQAVGTELRYVDLEKSAFITIDYDTHFAELNAAIFNGSLTLPDKSTIRAAVDYRKAPYLNTWTAVQGQQYKTLYDLLKEKTQDDAQQMAVDRTATYKSASVGYTRQLSEKLQLNLDFTAADIEGTIASYGVDATPATGTEYYYSAQLVGNNLLTADDLWTAAIRYSDLEDSSNYAVDFSTRYALTQDLRISPRVLLAYREGKTTDLKEYSVLPTVLMDYVWKKDLNFELEVGSRISWNDQSNVETQDAEFFITAGVRYDFHADKQQLQ
jgi:hypothetical protein